MFDIVGKVYSFIAAALVFFVLTITLYAQKQDMTVQSYVDNAVEEFVDTARTSGYVTKQNYDTLITKLDATHSVYRVTITHYKNKTNYVNVGGSSFEENFDAYNKDDILKILNDQSLAGASPKYIMSKGDYFRVEVSNVNPTLAKKLMGLFLRGDRAGGQIRKSYGGYIGYTNR